MNKYLYRFICLFPFICVHLQATPQIDKIINQKPLRYTPEMTRKGEARFVADCGEVLFLPNTGMKIRLVWLPSQPDAKSPFGAEWHFLNFKSSIKEVKPGRVRMVLPGGREVGFTMVKGNLTAKKGELFCIPGKEKGDFRVEFSRGGALLYKAGKIVGSEIPDPSQGNALIKHDWVDPAGA